MTRTQLWLVAFVWTNALELPIYTIVLQRRFARWWAVVVLTLAVNTVTHPLLWFVFPQFAPFWLYAVVAEAAVVCVEAALIAGVLTLVAPHPRRPVVGLALLAATLANVCSAVVGSFVIAAFRV